MLLYNVLKPEEKWGQSASFIFLDLGEIAMGIELIKGKNDDLTDEIKDMEEEVLEDIVAEE